MSLSDTSPTPPPASVDPTFIQTTKNTFGTEGEAWLSALPDLIAEASRRWNLTNIQPVSNLSYNFAAYALSGASDSKRSRSAAQREVVLKIGFPNRELSGEIAALRHFNGRGAVRLLDADPEKGTLLLERLQPGNMLAALEDDAHATQIAADVMLSLWKGSSDFAKHPVRDSRYKTTSIVSTDFIQLEDWFAGFNRLRNCFDGGTGPLPKKLVETAESLSKELLAENKDETLLHGDFHHFNVLRSQRGWLAIDPKGVIGPRGYEVGPLLINPVPEFLNGSNPKSQTEMRINILFERLGMERERIRAWGLCHAVLSAWWSLEDGGDWEYGIRCAEVFLTT